MIYVKITHYIIYNLYYIILKIKIKGKVVKTIQFVLSVVAIPIVILYASDSDWSSDSWQEDSTEKFDNSAFEKMKIKNRAKKEYDDKVYEYITGDYKAENNNIELGTIHLDNRLKNDDIEINVVVEDLKVEGDSYKDSIDIKQNKYKNFVQNDEKGNNFFKEEDTNFNNGGVNTIVNADDSRYHKVPNEDITELETIDLRGKDNIKEVNVFMEDVNIIVD